MLNLPGGGCCFAAFDSLSYPITVTAGSTHRALYFLGSGSRHHGVLSTASVIKTRLRATGTAATTSPTAQIPHRLKKKTDLSNDITTIEEVHWSKSECILHYTIFYFEYRPMCLSKIHSTLHSTRRSIGCRIKLLSVFSAAQPLRVPAGSSMDLEVQ